MDMGTGKISNRLISLGGILGFAYRISTCGYRHSLLFLGNLFIPVVLLILLFHMRALGAGDIKLLSMTGIFLETKQVFLLVGVSLFAAAVLSLAKMMGQCNLKERLAYFVEYANRCQKEKRLLTYQTGNSWDCLIHFSVAVLIAYFIVWR